MRAPVWRRGHPERWSQRRWMDQQWLALCLGRPGRLIHGRLDGGTGPGGLRAAGLRSSLGRLLPGGALRRSPPPGLDKTCKVCVLSQDGSGVHSGGQGMSTYSVFVEVGGYLRTTAQTSLPKK
ncbi:unnamed protein product [Boreogadus saida]